jgi:hypothetical protein
MWIAQNRLRLALLRTQALAEMAQIQATRGDRRAAFAYALKIPDPQILPEPYRAAVHALLLEANVPPEVLYFTLPETPDTHDEPEGNAGTTLTAQLPNIFAGRSYINFHTVQFQGGEIRGQLTVVPEPSTLALLGTGLLPLSGMLARKRRHRRSEA